MKADRKREERGGGGKREEWGVIMSTSLMLATYRVRIFQLKFWLDPQGKTETSLPILHFFLFPCEEFSDFQIQYSAGGLQNIQNSIQVWRWCVNSEHIYVHITIFLFVSICFCSLLELDIMNIVLFLSSSTICNLNTWGHDTTSAHVEV